MILIRLKGSDGFSALPMLAGIDAGIRCDCGRPGHRDLYFAVQIKLADQRQRQLRKLSLPRRRINVGTYAAENGADFILGFNVFKKSGSIRTVVTVAILRRAPSLRRVGDDHALRTIDLGKAAPDAGAAGYADRALEHV